MLEILSETKDPKRVQPHLKKCFEGIARLEFNGGTEDVQKLAIVGMESSEGEKVPFAQSIFPLESGSSVEKWLLKVESEMLRGVKASIDASYAAYATTAREKWVEEWPGQAVLCTSSTYWTSEVEVGLSWSSNCYCISCSCYS